VRYPKANLLQALTGIACNPDLGCRRHSASPIARLDAKWILEAVISHVRPHLRVHLTSLFPPSATRRVCFHALVSPSLLTRGYVFFSFSPLSTPLTQVLCLSSALLSDIHNHPPKSDAVPCVPALGTPTPSLYRHSMLCQTCSRDVVGRSAHVPKRDGRQGQSDRHEPRMNGGGSLI
jgi:hypothetical protein